VTMPPSPSLSATWCPNSRGAPAFKRGMIRVCGSNKLTSFSHAGTCCWARTRCRVWRITCWIQAQVLVQSPCGHRALLSEGFLNHLGLADDTLGHLEQSGICLLLIRFLVGTDYPLATVNLAGDAAHTAHPIAKDFPNSCYGVRNQRTGTANPPGHDPHPVHQEATVGRMMDRRLDGGPIQTQLASLCDFCLHGEVHHPFIEVIQRCRRDRLVPAYQRRGCRHRCKIDAPKPA
jgi:hypothetical protein